MLSSSYVAESYVFLFQIWSKFDKNWRYHDVWKKRVKQEKLILRKSMVKFDIEWKLTEYPMRLKMTWMLNMCDKLCFLFFFHLKLRQHIFQGINETIWKKKKKVFFIFDWRSAVLRSVFFLSKHLIQQHIHKWCVSAYISCAIKKIWDLEL